MNSHRKLEKAKNNCEAPNVESECRALASTIAKLTWISYILRGGVYLPQPPLLFCNNINVLFMTFNRVLHVRTKHMEIDYHFVREKVAFDSLQ